MEGWVFGNLYKINNYPGLILNKDGNKVNIEIYLLKDAEKAIKIIDDYEEVGIGFSQPNEYTKTYIDIHTSSGLIKCLTYLYNWPVIGKRKIKSGIF